MSDFPKFYGHNVLSFGGVPYGLIPDLILALLPLVFLGMLRSRNKSKGCGCLYVPMWVLFILFLPNTTYLALEVRHLYVIDNIADTRDSVAFMAFVAIGTIGLFLNVVTIINATYGRSAQIIFLSFLSACGAVLGINSLNSYDAFLHPIKTVMVSLSVFTQSKWLLTTLVIFIIVTIASTISAKVYTAARNESLL